MEFPKALFDPSKISGKYSALAAVLVVAGMLFAVWLGSAGGAVERVIAGVLLVLVLGGATYALMRLANEAEGVKSAVRLPGLGRVSPPARTSAAAGAAPRTGKYAPPDGSYLIDRPPPHWRQRELTEHEWAAESTGVSDPTILAAMAGPLRAEKEIVVFETVHRTIAIPVLGKTLFNGRPLDTVLPIQIVTRLAVTPLPRAQPPVYVELPLLHNFLRCVGLFLQQGSAALRDLTTGAFAATGRQYWLATFEQEWAGVAVDGVERVVKVTTVLYGIEGDVGDHLLVMTYPSTPALGSGPDDAEVLRGLVDSFETVTVGDADDRLARARAEADRRFAEVRRCGAYRFVGELGTTLNQLSGCDLDDPQQRLTALLRLKPFEAFAAAVGVNDALARELTGGRMPPGGLTALWAAIREAEVGDPATFKAEVRAWVDSARPRGPAAMMPGPASVRAGA